VAPLDRKIARFGSARPSGASEFHITEPRVNGVPTDVAPLFEYFAPAQFFDMPDDQKLSAESFELMSAGVRFGVGAAAFGAPIAADLGFEEIVVDSAVPPQPAGQQPKPAPLDAASLFVQVQWGAANQSAARAAGRAKYRGGSLGVSLVEPRFAITRNDTKTQPPTADNLTFSQAKADLREIRRTNPVAFATMQVVPQKQETGR
jgi:hypothetical protein